MFSNFRNVIVREMQRIFRRPLYLLSTVGVMLVIYIFFFTLMREGTPQNLPIGIVDNDNSTISRRVAREINATPYINVVYKYSSFSEAREAMQRNEIYAFVVIPQDFYADILAYRRPKLTYYMNQAYLMGGSLSMKELMTMANLAPAAVQREVLRAKGYNEDAIMGLIQPIVVDAHLIGNPYMNYPIYLFTTIFPGILGLVILLTTTYAIGIELKNKTSRQWLRTAGNSYPIAILGKMLPYTIIYLILELIGLIIMYLFMDYPMLGNLGYYMIGALIFIITMQAIGIFFIGIIPVTNTAISLSILYGILAITMSGFTYPIEAMLPAIQGLSLLFPLRSFYLFTAETALMGLPISETIYYILAIVIFMFTPFLIRTRLHKALIYQNYPIN